MKPTISIQSLFALLLLVGSVRSFADEMLWSGTCHVSFSGESTLHDFAGTVDAEPFTVSISTTSDLGHAKASSHVVVKADGMDTDNEKRDAEMRECMETATYPEIVVDLDEMPVAATEPALDGKVPRPTVIPFTITLMGKKHELTGKVSDWSYRDEEVDCTVSFPVSLKESGITPPNVLGLVKVKDEILVSARMHLKRG